MLTGWWVSTWYERAGPFAIVAWVIIVLGSITLHELAHGWAAIWRGDRTPIESGHMTWNPVVHMGLPSLIVFAVIGIAWGMMPVNPARFRGRHDDAIVAIAGPVMNLLLAALCIVLGAAWVAVAGGYATPALTVSDNAFRDGQVFFRLAAALNIVLAIFNMLPAPPLDGSRILATFWPRYREIIEGPNGQNIALFSLIVLLYFGGRYIYPIGFDTAISGTQTLAHWMTGGRVPLP
ncbi:MAG: site-2 protease family protein [Phycisphaeraceae bacterium]|nr:site-2 protease family protein [Phycisphaeraceae bacterium]